MKKSKRIKKSNSWKIKQHRDQFFKKSKTLGYRSRASFKLIELNKKYNFIKKSTNLLDLGSSPGGWSQVATQIIKEGRIMALDIKDMDIIELNEAFASQSLACMKDLNIDPEKVNIDGGAIALGHPLGATGTRITAKAAQIMQREKKQYALATQCIGLGQGIATILKSY